MIVRQLYNTSYQFHAKPQIHQISYSISETQTTELAFLQIIHKGMKIKVEDEGVQNIKAYR